jgi:hypothetical protein
MGVPTLEVGYTSATTRRGVHEVHKGHVVALEKKSGTAHKRGAVGFPQRERLPRSTANFSVSISTYQIMRTALFSSLGYGDHYCIITPRSRVLLEKLTVPQLVKRFPAFYGTRRFIALCLHACSNSDIFCIIILPFFPNQTNIITNFESQQDRRWSINVRSRRVRVTIFALEKK